MLLPVMLKDLIAGKLYHKPSMFIDDFGSYFDVSNVMTFGIQPQLEVPKGENQEGFIYLYMFELIVKEGV